MNDRLRWNAKYRAEFQTARVNSTLIQVAQLLKPGRVLDLAGGLGQNSAWLASLAGEWRVVNADASDEALLRAPAGTDRVVADAGALPFAPNTFDTILNIRFYDPRVIFQNWLAPGGTVFFQTYTEGDVRYRPDFNPAHRFPLAQVSRVFAGLDLLKMTETDDGKRVYVTIIARKA